jgi:hypothetical protein
MYPVVYYVPYDFLARKTPQALSPGMDILYKTVSKLCFLLDLQHISANLPDESKHGIATVVPYFMCVQVIDIIANSVNEQDKVNLLNRTSHKNKGSEKCASGYETGCRV